MSEQTKQWKDLTPQEKKDSIKGLSIILALGFFAYLYFSGFFYFENITPISPNSTKEEIDKFYQEVSHSIYNLDSKITKVEIMPQSNGKPQIIVNYTTQENIDFLFMASMKLSDLAQKISTRKWSSEFTSILIFLSTPTIDKYGNESTSLAFKLKWLIDDLKLIQWKNITNWDFLNLVHEIEVKGIGRQILQEYVQSENNIKYSKPFLQKAKVF